YREIAVGGGRNAARGDMTHLFALALLMAAGPSAAQTEKPAEENPWSLDLTIRDVGIGIGNSKHIDGIRLNFRDVAAFTVHGINVTIWWKDQEGQPGGTVDGLALGVPLTGARRIRGLGLGFGLGTEEALDGVGVGILGLGTGGSMHGILVGGLGMGA